MALWHRNSDSIASEVGGGKELVSVDIYRIKDLGVLQNSKAWNARGQGFGRNENV